MFNPNIIIKSVRDATKIGLVHSGAGVLGCIEIGGDAALYDAGFIPSELIGTSAGSIIAALLALGFKPKDLWDILLKANFEELIPMSFFGWVGLPFRRYVASNEYVIEWLKDITDNAKASECVIPLTTVTTDMVIGKTVTFNSTTNRGIYLWEMIIPSMSIPDIYPMWKKRYVDGGVADNLGINFLTTKDRKIALRIDAPILVKEKTNFIEEQIRLINIMLSTNETDMIILGNHLGVEVVNLHTDGFTFLETDMTTSDKTKLYNLGYNTTANYLKDNPHG